MKHFLIILISMCLLSCEHGKTGLILKKDGVSIAEKNFSFHKIVPLINQKELIQTGSDTDEEKTIVHYKESSGEKKVDLIFRTISSDSVMLYQISASLPQTTEWLSTDTLKLLFDTSDTIKAGIYSILYSPVFCWTKPVHFTNFNKIAHLQGIQFAYWKYANDFYAAALPLGGNGFAFSLGSESKGFGAIGTLGVKTNIVGEIPMLALSVSSDFYRLTTSTFQYSFTAMGIPDNLRVKKTKPDMYNYLGWASWNAFMHNISEEKILEAAKSLKALQIPVKWFLIDDGWLDMTDNKLNSYSPDKKKFPKEFLPLTSKLRNDYGIKDIGLWHTLNGYWEGLNNTGRLLKNINNVLTYSDCIPWLSKTAKPLNFVNPFSDEGYSFYDDWYKYLSAQGISFIKVDNQLVVKKLADGNSPFWQTGEKVFGNLHTAASRYFNGNVINCMGMLNNDYYHYSKTSVARTVEDYNPENDDKLFSCEFKGNAAAHILASVHNSVWLSNIVWADYDMFQSYTKDAWYYAIAKVMSSGPVYISDEPGKHNANLLKSITFNTGRLINADKPALPTEDCLFQLFESEKPFKVFSSYKNNGLLAAWNVSDKEIVAGSFSPSMIRELNGTRFVVFEYFSKSVFETGLNSENNVILNRMGCKLFSIFPLTFNRAVIGDISKVIPMAAVLNLNVTDNAIRLEVNEKCTLWVYSKSKPVSLKINSETISNINYNNNILSVRFDADNSNLEIEF